MKKNIIAILLNSVMLLTSLAACSSFSTTTTTPTVSVTSDTTSTNQTTTAVDDAYVTKVTEIGKKDRLAKMAEAKERKNDTLSEKIETRMDIAWGEWQPDYEGWLKWSNDLYADSCTVNAIGGKEQNFREYQASMQQQRETCYMSMGPIVQQIVEGNVVALVYHMYLTPKGSEKATTYDMVVTEFNTLQEIDGQLKVTHLDLYTDGGGLKSN